MNSQNVVLYLWIETTGWILLKKRQLSKESRLMLYQSILIINLIDHNSFKSLHWVTSLRSRIFLIIDVSRKLFTKVLKKINCVGWSWLLARIHTQVNTESTLFCGFLSATLATFGMSEVKIGLFLQKSRRSTTDSENVLDFLKTFTVVPLYIQKADLSST